MSTKYCVIGLGRFGYQVATSLAENDMEVMAIDSNEELVSAIKDQVTQAICINITDEASLRSIGVEEMDIVVVAIGENFAQSIIITVLLKKALKIPKIIARAINDMHRDILKLVGADRIVLPEKEIGVRLADSLSSSVTDLIRLGKQFSIGQIEAPKKFIGKKVIDLNLFESYLVHCIGLKDNKDAITTLSPEYIIKEHDRLIVAGKTADLEEVADL